MPPKETVKTKAIQLLEDFPPPQQQDPATKKMVVDMLRTNNYNGLHQLVQDAWQMHQSSAGVSVSKVDFNAPVDMSSQVNIQHLHIDNSTHYHINIADSFNHDSNNTTTTTDNSQRSEWVPGIRLSFEAWRIYLFFFLLTVAMVIVHGGYNAPVPSNYTPVDIKPER